MKLPAVAVAISGGIDSLVSGFLIRRRTENVFGIHFSTGYETQGTDVSCLENQLGFSIFRVDLSAAFEKEVVDYFISTYLKGQTPNPCLVCNARIKFGVLAAEARKRGADVLATGHYARVVNALSFPQRKIARPWLEKGADRDKDQSYFLSRLSRAQLDRVLFPLAEFTKAQVRQMARENDLRPVNPEESQDICFLHENEFFTFILDKTGLTPEKGEIRDAQGKTIGTHRGVFPFTIGQRRGINCPGPEPYYVRKIDPTDNILHVCFKKDLIQKEMQVTDLCWNDDDFPSRNLRVRTKIRYGHREVLSRLIVDEKASPSDPKVSGQVIFDQAQEAVTPGQAAVFYEGDRVLGSAIIQ